REPATVGLNGEHRAGLDRHAVEEDGARAAARRVAPDVRSGEPQRLAQEMHEQESCLDLGRPRLAVHGRRHRPCRDGGVLDGCHLLLLLLYAAPAAATAVRSPRSVKTRTTLRL